MVLGDEDEAFVTLFADYLMNNVEGVEIHIYTNTNSYLNDERHYDLGIFSKTFIAVNEFSGKSKIGHVIYLYEKLEEEYQYLTCIYKYQSIDTIIDRIEEFKLASNEVIQKKNTTCVGILSPMNHELSLPFALSLAKIISETKKTLFVDIEEFSIMPELMEEKSDRNIADVLFELNQGVLKCDFGKYINSYHGIEYIAPFIDPNEINDIDEETWIMFFDAISNLGYETIVVYFGCVINGFNTIYKDMDKIILSKPGDYYSKFENKYALYSRREFLEEPNIIRLPMSAGNLMDGTYCLDELLCGNLGRFVRETYYKANEGV